MNIEDSLGYIICTVARKIHQHLTEKFKENGITPEQWVVLRKLSEEDGISQREIAERVDKDPNNIKVLVDKLESKSYVKRSVNPNDKRAFSLNITAEGLELIKKLKPLDDLMITDIETGLSSDEIASLKNILTRVQMNINQPKTKS